MEIVRRVLNEFLVSLERGDPGAFFDLDVVPNDYEFVLAEPIDLKRVWIGREEFVEFMRTWTPRFFGGYTASMTVATPIPTPTQSVAIP